MLISNNDKVFDRGSADNMIIWIEWTKIVKVATSGNSTGQRWPCENQSWKILWNAGAYSELFFFSGGGGGVSAPPTLNFNKQKKINKKKFLKKKRRGGGG